MESLRDKYLADLKRKKIEWTGKDDPIKGRCCSCFGYMPTTDSFLQCGSLDYSTLFTVRFPIALKSGKLDPLLEDIIRSASQQDKDEHRIQDMKFLREVLDWRTMPTSYALGISLEELIYLKEMMMFLSFNRGDLHMRIINIFDDEKFKNELHSGEIGSRWDTCSCGSSCWSHSMDEKEQQAEKAKKLAEIFRSLEAPSIDFLSY